jgi:hypothetical protein
MNWKLPLLLATLTAGCGIEAKLRTSTGTSPSPPARAASSPAPAPSPTRTASTTSSSPSSPSTPTPSPNPGPRAIRHVTVPDLADVPLAEAKKRLRDAGFTGKFFIEENAGCGFRRPIAARAVCRTRPAPGMMVGRSITLLLSGPDQGTDAVGRFARMPDVLGWSIARARAHLTRLGYKVVVETTSESRNKKQKVECKADHVCFQRPLPGVKAYDKLPRRLKVGSR